MKIQTTFHLLGAEAYGIGNYSCGDFEQGCVSGAGTGANGGSLVNTGYDVIIPVALAAALIISAAILLVTKFVRKRKTAPTA